MEDKIQRAIEYFKGLLKYFDDKPDEPYWGKVHNATSREMINTAITALERQGEITALTIEFNELADGLFTAHKAKEYLAQITALQAEIAELRARLTEYEQAENDGRILIPPCKIGDTVYIIKSLLKHKNNPQVHKANVDRIAFWDCDSWIRINCYDAVCIEEYKFGDFGKTVFLTCEAAESALAELEREAEK